MQKELKDKLLDIIEKEMQTDDISKIQLMIADVLEVCSTMIAGVAMSLSKENTREDMATQLISLVSKMVEEKLNEMKEE